MLQSNDRIGKTERYHYCRPARSPQRPDIPPTYPPVDDHRLAQIVEMGFSTEMSRNALIITRGNFEEALNLLISSPERYC